MKVRFGFVSNSSSSSFTCSVCNEEASGWDMGLDEAEMFECENGHTMCKIHARKDLKETYDVLAEYCPICSFDVVVNDDMVPYLLNKLNIKREDVVQEVKSSFKDYSLFKKSLK